MGSRPVLVLGDAMYPFGRYTDGSTPRDWIRTVVDRALADADLELRDIDAVVVGSESDHLSMQLSAGALIADEIGIFGCPVTRVEMGGATGAAAIQVAAAQVLAGLARFVLVIGFEHAASHLKPDDVRFLYGLSFDADIDGMAGIQAIHLYALSIAEHMRHHGTTERHLASVVVKNRSNAAANPLAHRRKPVTVDEVLSSRAVSTPYKALDCSPLSDGAAALIVGREEPSPARGRRSVAIVGVGSANDPVRLGDRLEPHRFDAKSRAAAAAYRAAGFDDPAAIDVAEVYDAFSGAEIQALEALGLCAAGDAPRHLEAGTFERAGRLPVNLSGGLIGQGGAPGAVGVAQVATLSRILQGRYWPELQPQREMKYGLADAHSGIGTVSIVHVLEAVS
jgi:acetyl-CoA C-acetyltransferase